MTKLPEPKAIASWGNGVGSVVGYTEEQMLQFRRDVLEEAAALAQKTICDTHIPTGINIYGTRAAQAIRKLKDETT
jgi:hypothetical protein